MSIFALMRHFEDEHGRMSFSKRLRAALATYVIRRLWCWLPAIWRSTIAVLEFRNQSPPDSWVVVIPMRTVNVDVQGECVTLQVNEAMSVRGAALDTTVAISLERMH